MTERDDLSALVVVITGGAGGQGAEEARTFAERGARVVIADVRDDEADELAASLGEQALAVHLDVADEGEWVAAIEAAEARFGPVTTLVNNAGTGSPALIADETRASFKRVLDVNLVGAFLGMKHAAPSMAKAGGGSIVNISSISGLGGFAGGSAYSASKWALRGLTRSAAGDLAPLGIRVELRRARRHRHADDPRPRPRARGGRRAQQHAPPAAAPRPAGRHRRRRRVPRLRPLELHHRRRLRRRRRLVDRQRGAEAVNGVALVTGGARGQGAAAARAFVRDGWQVVIGDVLDEPGEAVAAELGDAARYVHLDVTDEADWAAAVELAESAFGPLTALVNNAGIIHSTPMLDETLEAFTPRARREPRRLVPRHPRRDPVADAGRRRLDREHLVGGRAAGRAARPPPTPPASGASAA